MDSKGNVEMSVNVNHPICYHTAGPSNSSDEEKKYLVSYVAANAFQPFYFTFHALSAMYIIYAMLIHALYPLN